MSIQNSNDARESLSDSHFRVLSSEPFYGIKMFSLTWIETSKIPTMATDGKRLLFNPLFTVSLSKLHLDSVFIHEALHVCLKHHIIMGRMKNKLGSKFDPVLFNYAADAEVNWMIKDMGRTLPNGCIYEARFHGKLVEFIYPFLAEERERKQQQQSQQQQQQSQETKEQENSEKPESNAQEQSDGENTNDPSDSDGDSRSDDSGNSDLDSSENDSETDDSNGSANNAGNDSSDDDSLCDSSDTSNGDSDSDSVENESSKGSDGDSDNGADSYGSIGGVMIPTDDEGNELENWELDELEKELETEIKASAKMAGKRGGGNVKMVEDIIDRMKPKPIDWSEIVDGLLTEKINTDYTYMRPRECYIPHDIYEPDMDTESTGKVCMMVDSSGSVNQDMFFEQMEKMNEILSQFKNLEILVIYFHHNVWKCEEYDQDDLPLNLTERKSGGTDYVPPFRKLSENGFDPDVTFVLTDLYCSSYPNPEPDCDVFWLLCRSGNYDTPAVPFGTVIPIFD